MKITSCRRLGWALLGTVLASSAIDAGTAPAKQFQRSAVHGIVHSKILPAVVDRTPVNVVVLLPGDSVADAQATAGRRLSRQEKNAIKAQRATEQAVKRGQIEGAGGRVTGAFQSALNGVKVTIPRNQLGALRQIPGVVDVVRVGIHKPLNVVSVPRIQAPIAWSGAAGVRGEGIKIGIIDTGIDYTHADFGGTGTPAAYQAALATDTAPANPSLFGPGAPKVKGGTDLVGDDYNADPQSDTFQPVPHPDPNPLDCNSHGTHVAGTAAGYGVLADGTTFHGTYDQLTYANNTFGIGPGVAPLANLYAIRVFGCEGSTDVVTDAIDWAVDNDMDVINMSLGSDFGSGVDSDSLAADAAVKAGVVVVSAAGNAGDISYVLGSPGGSVKGIAVAASAREASDRTANFSLPAVTGAAAKTITALNANNANWPSPESLTVVVLRSTSGAVSLGCDPQEYVNAGVTGKIAVVQRGTCARVARAIFGQQAGAAAVVMINNANSLPPFEGEITSNPDTGEQFTVTIPFFGVKGPVTTATSDGAALVLRDGQAIRLTEGTPIATGMASFSSSGPRTPDARLKPDITAPGTNIISAGMGTGNGTLIDSGTSMATPHITGVAALTIQAHPKWKPDAIKSAIINSGNPGDLPDYQAHRAGSGLVNAAAAVGTQAIAFADRDETTLNFQMQEFSTDFSQSGKIHVRNDGTTSVSFNVSVNQMPSSPHTLSLGTSQITVPARSQGTVDVTLTVPAATVGDSTAMREVSGIVTLTPTVPSSNHGYTLRVPYYLVPRVSSNVDAKISIKAKDTQGVVSLTNRNSPIAGTADFYAWGLEDQKKEVDGRLDLHAAGVQTFPSDGVLAFAVNTYKGWSTAEQEEFDISIDTNGDGIRDYVVFNADVGLVLAGLANGQVGSFVANAHTGALSINFLADAPTDGSTIVLPVVASDLGLSAASPRFTYTVQSFDQLSNQTDTFNSAAAFNAFQSSVSTGDFVPVNPNQAIGVTVTVNPTEFAITPAKGLMIVTHDNKNGASEVNLLNIKR
jgi:minor extracellular serine protease Vpr